MPTRSRDLLDQIADLQNALEGFSFDQLTVSEARALKMSFNQFRTRLEDRLWAPANSRQLEPGSSETAEMGTGGPADETVAELLATVSHELRTPLHAISQLSQFLSQGKLNEQQTEQVQAIGAAADSMLLLVGELLEYARLQSEHEPVRSLVFNPGQLIEQVSYLCGSLIVSDSVSFELDLDPQMPKQLVGDPSRFSQILMNLLGNAIKFVEQGRIELRIWPEFQDGACLLHGAVRDTGPGISAADLPFVFDAFRKGTGASENQQGIGLGLSIVKKSLDRLGGSISAESREGAGSTFRFVIPFHQTPGQTTMTDPAPESLERPLAGKTILIIEDNLLNQKLLSTRLKGWGCRVLVSEKAIYGIGMLSEERVDLVLTDLRMPGMDGYQASVRIRNHDNAAISKIPIVAVTADLSAEDSQQVRRSGINDVLLKPFCPEELLEKVLRQLNPLPGHAYETCPEEPDDAPMNGILNLSGLWKECMGDIEMLEEMTRLFRANLLEFLGALKTHLTLLDYEQIEASAHKVNAGLKLMEVQTWLSKVKELRELNQRQTGVERMRQIYRELIKSYPDLESALNQALEEVKKNNTRG